MHQKISGVVVPLLTPINRNGDIDVENYKELARHCIKNGIGTLFLMGTAGEGHSISEAEKLKALRQMVPEFGSQVNLVCGVLEPSTSRAIHFIKSAEELGFRDFAVVPPYYDETNNDELYDHYKMISSSLNKDSRFYLYNIPGATGVDISVEMVKEIKKFGNVAGIKNSSSDLLQLINLIDQVKDPEFSVLQGYEDLAVAGLIFGADGIVPCGGNVYPGFFQKMYELSLGDNYKRLLEIEKTARKILDVQLFASNWRVSLKAAVERLEIAKMGMEYFSPSITKEQYDNLTSFLKSMEKEVEI